MAKSSCFCRLAVISFLLSSYWLSGIRSDSTTAEYTQETQSSKSTDNLLTTPGAMTTAKDDIYCGDEYECDDPFTMNSEHSPDEDPPCACRSSYMNTGKCCLSQWWIIGLALGAGAVVILAFVIAVGCCCSYKGKAKKATTEAGKAQHLSRKLQDDLDRMELRVIESSANRDVAIATIPGHSDPVVTKGAVHPSTAPVVAAAAAAAIQSSSEHHVSSDAHPEAHPPHSVNTAPPAAAAAVVVAAVAQDTRRHDDGIGHGDVTKAREQRSNAGQLHRQGGGGGGHGADEYHDLRHSPEPDYSRHYDNHRAPPPPHRPVTSSSFVDPYFGASRTNPVYADDNDSLEAYDDTAPPTRNNHNYYRPTTAYNNHHVINRPSFRY